MVALPPKRSILFNQLQTGVYLVIRQTTPAPDAARHLLYGTYGSTEGIMNLTVLDAETNTKSTRTMVVTV